ncbi:MAG TPA: class I SAM-dependent methyltransferase [Myxococcaceae bacterium]|nr:class I SAM-dependent methyltransferase [Myxococcaceae bacterium]
MAWLMSRMYDRFLEGSERAGLRDWRRALLERARGEVLELGAGTGGNLALYPSTVTRLVLTEPDRHMRQVLERKLAGRPRVEVIDAPAEALPLRSASFDTVVATLVLCSVQDPRRVLSEIHRLLRPGGTFLFLEHVAAPAGTWTRHAQGALEPVWKRIAANCHLTRETGPLLEAAGFELAPCTEERLPGSSALVGRSIRGVARPLTGGGVGVRPGNA